MRDFCICILSFCILVLTIGHCIQNVKIANLERQLKRIEYEYDAVLTENEKMERMNDQMLRLMAEGGWYDVVGFGTDY
jgi:hypothetical protein